ncbi:MAG: hypothetical protein FJW97_08090 [Actinobacteria bacterium]|nr:hypothetical protein [Actinomycetota bacterium]
MVPEPGSSAATIDQRGIPTNACVMCGCNILVIRAVFEDYELTGYLLDAECACCGSPVTAPCPLDRPDEY